MPYVGQDGILRQVVNPPADQSAKADQAGYQPAAG